LGNYFTKNYPYIDFLNGKQGACFQKSSLYKTGRNFFITVNFNEKIPAGEVEFKNTSAEATLQALSNCNKRLS